MNPALPEQSQAAPQPIVVVREVEKTVRPSFASGLLKSMLGQTLTHLIFGNISLAFIPLAMAAILGLIGWKVSAPGAVGDKVTVATQKAEAFADKLAGGVKDAVPGFSLPGFAPKSPEQVEAETKAKEAARLVREESETNKLRAIGDRLGVKHQPDWTLEKLRIEVGEVQRSEAEAPERKLLQARAEKACLSVDPAWDIRTYRKQVEGAEKVARSAAEFKAAHAAWEKAVERWEWNRAHSPLNARCPRCRHAMHIGDARIDGHGICARCGAHFTCRQARSLFVPPPRPVEPVPGGQRKGLFGCIFG